jgi:hypothetical protein
MYCKPIINTEFLNADKTVNQVFYDYIKSISLFKLHRLYIPLLSEDGRQFELVIVDIEEKKCSYIDPTIKIGEKNKIQQTIDRRNSIKHGLMLAFSSLENAPEGIDWKCEFHDQLFTYNAYDQLTDENSFDAGVYLLIILDMLYYDLPLIFRRTSVDQFRNYYMYHFLNNNLLVNS